MDYVSIVELADKAGVSGNTVILYLSMFEDFFTKHRVIDDKKQYPAEKVELIRTIHQLYQRQRFTKQEIRERLLEVYPDALDAGAPPDPYRHLGRAIDELTREIRLFNQEGLPGLIRTVSTLSDNLNQLSQASHTDIKKPSMMDILLTTRPDEPMEDPGLGGMIHSPDRGSAGAESKEQSSAGGAAPPPQGERAALDPDQPMEAVTLEDTGSSSPEEVIGIILSMHASGMTPTDILEALDERSITISWNPSDLEL
ncbi:MAG: hypothetical protein V1793_07460 [Pseudomonadota bacterium]